MVLEFEYLFQIFWKVDFGYYPPNFERVPKVVGFEKRKDLE